MIATGPSVTMFQNIALGPEKHTTAFNELLHSKICNKTSCTNNLGIDDCHKEISAGSNYKLTLLQNITEEQEQAWIDGDGSGGGAAKKKSARELREEWERLDMPAYLQKMGFDKDFEIGEDP